MEVAAAGAKEVDAAVRAARACFRSEAWGPNSTGKQRAEKLRRMASTLTSRKADFVHLECLDNGKPKVEAEADMDFCIDVFNYYAGLAEKLDEEGPHGGTVPVSSSDPDLDIRLRKEPFGVIGMVSPWNFPLMQAVLKVAPALGAGCTMVLKPSEICPATSLMLGELALAAELPPGALNVLSGTGPDAGQPLLDHPMVDRLSFTGSGRTGHMVLSAASKRLIPASIELGGKSAMVVFDDVDIEATVDWIMCGIFICAGQICSATSRVLIHDRVYDKVVQRLVEETNKIKLGDALAEDTQMGPVVSLRQLELISGFVERAKESGVSVLTGGARAPGLEGFFYQPTILANLTDSSEAWTDEIFGPVLAVRRFSTEEEGVRMANDTPFGLAASVCSADASRAARVANKLDAGIVWQNCSNALTSSTPFGGFKTSGFGKECGEMGFEEYLRVKTVVRAEPTHTWNWFVKK